MSIETYSPSVAGFHCEAVTPDTVALPCLHGRLANIPDSQASGVGHAGSRRDHPAVLIGLALACVRQGPPVPVPVMAKLGALADHDDAACRLVLDWLKNRNRHLGLLPDGLSRSAPLAMSAKTKAVCRSIGERVQAASAKAGHLDGRRRIRTRPRDTVTIPETAIIAAESGGRVDG
ncbi:MULTISPECIES: hypothetical protein [unclassified Rhizobium]|uniref:hypothetical protein n=1 Tax=unclassified Rhizobium TaxID=2613769 RepID=UPI000BE980B1|nr:MULTISPECIES: hypothetical protein [unclassified Rhizobium]MDF0660829.1 hypothetical protein [Rhizobium sp. BC49]PDS85678.1 hypothetical protein CO654_10585 [Rhizobium sp. L18]